MSQTHEIASVADLARVVTTDNIDELASDLKSFLIHIVTLKLACEVVKQPFEPEKMGLTSLSWTPDGKGECTTHVQAKDAEPGAPELLFRTFPTPSNRSARRK